MPGPQTVTVSNVHIPPMSRHELEKRLDELTRQYHETKDLKIVYEIAALTRRLKELDRQAS